MNRFSEGVTNNDRSLLQYQECRNQRSRPPRHKECRNQRLQPPPTPRVSQSTIAAFSGTKSVAINDRSLLHQEYDNQRPQPSPAPRVWQSTAQPLPAPRVSQSMIAAFWSHTTNENYSLFNHLYIEKQISRTHFWEYSSISSCYLA